MARASRYDEDEDYDDEEFGAPGLERGLPLGLLAMTPLWLAYEWAQMQNGGALRNASEVLLTLPLRPTGTALESVRRAGLAVILLAALVHCVRRRLELVPLLLKVVGAGILGALALGPLLVFLVGRFGDALPPLPQLGEHSVGDSSFCWHVLGSAAWEECLFRVLLFPLLYLFFKELIEFIAGRQARDDEDDWEGEQPGLGQRVHRISAELLAAIGSSLIFAGYHVSTVLSPLGIGGEPFRPALFTYRFLAGMLLVALFRWRGPGVAAWSHGVFNLALCLGAGPAVFQ